MLKTICVALSMYSAVPVPQVDWSPRNMRYAMIAFPLVGLICGFGIYFWYKLNTFLNFSNILQGIGIVLIPVIVTGGIHLDGFCDTVDALASHAPLEKKLEILKDSNAGAFAVIGAVSYFLFYFGLACELTLDITTVLILTAIHVFSRCLSGISVATFPCAKNSGLLYAFQDGASRRAVAAILTVLSILLVGVFALLAPYVGLLIPLIGLVVFAFYRHLSMKIFNGITGDLAGWFLCLSELFMVFIWVIGGKL